MSYFRTGFLISFFDSRFLIDRYIGGGRSNRYIVVSDIIMKSESGERGALQSERGAKCRPKDAGKLSTVGKRAVTLYPSGAKAFLQQIAHFTCSRKTKIGRLRKMGKLSFFLF